ncbi:MAG: NAD-dependent epimerase/dehydratase family protein [Gammaproteobacteria bacterium]|nr:NAD-dependent epimerase/dehydratase family protein [Gammaproteobacteria bacterium]
MKVLVAGSASRLAQALLPVLAADSRIEQIIGLDWQETSFSHERFTQVLLDVRSPQIARLMAGMKAVIHVPYPADREHEQQRDLQLQGGQNLFRCAAQQGVGCLVHLSTAAVYQLPARERPMSEKHPRLATPGLAWVEDQVAFEEWLDVFESVNSDQKIIRLRPHLIVGPQARAANALLRLPFSVRLATPHPRLQCVHEDDVGQAVMLALVKDVSGAFNLACANAAALHEMQWERNGGLIGLPFPIANALLRAGHRLNIGIDPAWLEKARYDITLDTSAARRKLGWEPRYDSVKACLKVGD